MIRWTGSAPPDQFAEFRLIARNPILEGELVWRITQTYANGETVRWIGPPGSDYPASITEAQQVGDARGRRHRAQRRRQFDRRTATTGRASAAAQSDEGGATIPSLGSASSPRSC